MTERVEVAIIGAGPAGLAAADVLGKAGCKVALLDEQPAAGGQIFRGIAAAGRQAKAPARRRLRGGRKVACRSRSCRGPAPCRRHRLGGDAGSPAFLLDRRQGAIPDGRPGPDRHRRDRTADAVSRLDKAWRDDCWRRPDPVEDCWPPAAFTLHPRRIRPAALFARHPISGSRADDRLRSSRLRPKAISERP